MFRLVRDPLSPLVPLYLVPVHPSDQQQRFYLAFYHDWDRSFYTPFVALPIAVWYGCTVNHVQYEWQ